MRIVTLPGSLRKGSYNRRLLGLAIAELEKLGAEIEAVDLCDHPLPLYDGDLEDDKGVPDEAWTLKSKIAASHGIVIACPEYNAGVPGVFKNVIDWTSRGGSNPWAGKVVGLMGASAGLWGTTRMMPHLRDIMTMLGCLIIPQQISVPQAAKVWNEAGEMTDEKLPGRVERFIGAFVATVQNHAREELSGSGD